MIDMGVEIYSQDTVTTASERKNSSDSVLGEFTLQTRFMGNEVECFRIRNPNLSTLRLHGYVKQYGANVADACGDSRFVRGGIDYEQVVIRQFKRNSRAPISIRRIARAVLGAPDDRTLFRNG